LTDKIDRILVTGANGFIGKNLVQRLSEHKNLELIEFGRESDEASLATLVQGADVIFHLAGVNRPESVDDFGRVNADLTQSLCNAIEGSGRLIPVVFTSSIQAELDNPYGRSKLKAEQCLGRLAESTGNPTAIYRLPGVFGKWCRPYYNSVVATFCHNIARDLPIQVNDPKAELKLVYIDDVIDEFLGAWRNLQPGIQERTVAPAAFIALGELAEQISAFKNCRTSLISERVGKGLARALYATYVSYLPPERFVYDVPQHGDQRGVFVEMLKTIDSGQFSYFTAHPGVTRGGHYHHTKTEKFLVIKGQARFGFRHVRTGERHEVLTSGEKPQIVETVPGWTHDVTNIGDDELVVMLWANENFDRDRPDTIANKV
jgi:UDP-2-acetamido-2,6-beta-L-arabino-hexul-4-ose reductase